MATNSPPVPFAAQDRITAYVKNACTFLSTSWNVRDQLLLRDRTYARELDQTKTQQAARVANESGDMSKMQNIIPPIVMPQVESSLADLAAKFLSSYPVFPVVSSPANVDAAMQMETILGESAIRFSWVRELLLSFRDGLKYNIHAVEVDWRTLKTWSIDTDSGSTTLASKGTEITYQGNAIKRLDMYNTILDTRVAPAEVHTRGEFAGYTELISRIELKMLLQNLDPTMTMNAKDAFESGAGEYSLTGANGAYYVPQVNPLTLLETKFNTTDWLQWAAFDVANKIKYSNFYEKTTLYARILPRELGIFSKNSGTVQIYKFIVINRQVPIYVERMTNYHDYLPIIVGQPLEDGLNYQTKSFADNAAPFQALSAALYSSAIQSQRRKVYDRIFYDPSRVDKASIDRTDVVQRIPVKSEGYGKPISEAVYQAPFEDRGTPDILRLAATMPELANIANGMNKVQQGQFQKGNKTRHEFDQVMQYSDLRQEMMALLIETQFLQPIKHILKTNILQYQPPATLYNRQRKQEVKVNPSTLRSAVAEFKLADGLLNSNKLISLDLLQQVVQLFLANPALANQWDIMGMLMYWLKMEGATWIDDFKLEPQQGGQQNATANGPPAGNSAPAAQ